MRLLSCVVFVIWFGTLSLSSRTPSKERSFVVDYENDQFLKDGQPFRFVAGEFHHFRALPQTWQKKLRTMRAAGLNAVTTYVEWSLHNPHDGNYTWDGMADVEEFVRLAAEEDLLVILRPGPYICGERDMGGFPFWLLRKYPDIKLRTSDPNYLKEVGIWYKELMPRFERYLYGNGGPIIMVQVENEYGAFGVCDKDYMKWLRDETYKYVNDKAVLFTNDMAYEGHVKCSKMENVLATLDFGPGSKSVFDGHWNMLRKHHPKGPLMNSEYYPGKISHWQEDRITRPPGPIADGLRLLLESGANVNFYMFFGGTNFGFTAGSNFDGPGQYKPETTTYDLDSPMDEAGDVTDKYMILRDVIKDFLPLPNISIPEKTPKITIPSIKLEPKLSLLSPASRRLLGSQMVSSVKPLTFEYLDQNSGFVLYETMLPTRMNDPSVLTVPTLHDRATVYVDDEFVGVLSRENKVNSLPISAGVGQVLRILVENQARLNYRILNDFQGIIGDVKLNNNVLDNWNITGFPFEKGPQINELISSIDESSKSNEINANPSGYLRSSPMIFYGTFDVDELGDTYINPSEWGKGLIFINGFNLGRYWPLGGPQVALYLPKELLNKKNNSIVLLELQRVPTDGRITFSDKPIFN